MAGDWIPVRKGLKNELEVLRLSVLTGLSRRVIVSILIDMWSWCDSVTADGIIKGVKLSEMSDICPDVERTFWRHVAEVGWIVETDDGIVIPNFDRWLGRSAKKRLKDALQKRCNRFAGRNVRDLSVSQADISATTEQNRTDNKTPLPPLGEETFASPDPQFLRFWATYPRQEQQGTAWRAWRRLNPDAALVEQILAAIERQKQSDLWKRDNGRWILAPSHWLRRRCWLDQPAIATPAGETTEHRHARIQREMEERRQNYADAAPAKLIKAKIRKALKNASQRDAESETDHESP